MNQAHFSVHNSLLTERISFKCTSKLSLEFRDFYQILTY
jgi:hypothetical protein